MATRPGMLRGTVKQVLSGDTVVVMGLDSSRGPPPEKQITLAYLSAPRLGNRNQPDAPFAWLAREALRARVIGKEVSFSVDYANAQGRQFGTVVLEPSGEDVGLAVVAEGWARVQPIKTDAAPSPAVERLLAAEAAAKEAALGVWTTDDGAAARATRVVDYAPDVAALLKAHQGQRVSAVVEHLNSASSLRLLLLPSFQSVSLLLAGVLTPSIRRNAETGAEDAQPFAREAKFFAESRVLHRTVRVALEGVDKSGNLVGSLFHVSAEINLGAELLKAGLGKVADWSLAMCGGGATVLRQAEAQAKHARLNLWRGYTPPAAREGMDEYAARVVEVLSADCLLVAPAGGAAGGAAPAEVRVYLSAVRVPRAGYERRADAGEPWAYEAKEWVRRAAVGKKVRVLPEFVRRLEAREAAAGGGEGGGGAAAKPEVERVYAAVFVGDKNLAAGLLGAGLATVNTQARGDEVSAHVDALLEAERGAKERKSGMHGTKPPAGQPWGAGQDLSLPANKARAQAFLPALQRETRVRATVLHVVHGARFKVLVPRENCVLAFALAGVRCPATARRDVPGSSSEPYADEAHAYARGALLQREIDIEVEGLDKNGVFMGALYAPEAKAPFAVALLEAGLARRIPPAADRSRHGVALEAAERLARTNRLKVWEGYVEEAAAAEEEEEVVEAPADGPASDAARALVGRLATLELTGTDVSDGATFYAQPCGAADGAPREARRIEEVLKGAGAISAPTFAPKAGQPCAARFAGDGSYYRAKVVTVGAGGDVDVFFVDYGNSQRCKASECRPLDPAISLTATPPLALRCTLAYLVAPAVDDDNGQDCALALSDAVLGRPVRARVERRAGNEVALTLLGAEPAAGSSSAGPSDAEPPPKPSIVAGTLNAQLVAHGLARVERRSEIRNPATAVTLEALRALQDTAKKERLGIWRYGDVEEDDAKEFGFTPRAESAWAKKK